VFYFRRIILFNYRGRKTIGLLSDLERKHETRNIGLGILAESCKGLGNRELNSIGSFIALVRVTRPKEAFQAVFAPPGDNVHMGVWHALADAIVHRYEGPVGFHC